jgi:Immunity protein 70
MALVLRVGDKIFPVGAPSFLKAWFSTIATRVEKGAWGTQFPTIMRSLYAGVIPNAQAANALTELERIRLQLATLPPEQVVWDFEDPSARPPWGTEISSEITSLANYFVTSDGEDLIEVLHAALGESLRTGRDVAIT